MRALSMAFSGLLGLAVVPGLTSSAGAATGSDSYRNRDATVQYSLVGDRDDHHRRHWRHHRGHGWDGWRHRYHYYPRHYGHRYYSYGYAPRVYSYPILPPPTYYVAPPQTYYYQYGPPAYYYGGNGFNLGFNFNFDD